MTHDYGIRRIVWAFLVVFVALLASACNLTSAPEEQLALTEMATTSELPTRTPLSTIGIPTPLPITPIVPPTSQILPLPPTSIAFPPTLIPFPTSTSLPISIVILSPIPGNVVAGNVQVLGAAIHPLFLQYQLEYGPDPNPGNLWYPATGVVQTPVLNGLLGIWNTTIVQDSVYQLRLRVTLRDGTSLATVVNSIRIQNRIPTPIPSATPNIPRPIAAFTVDRAIGQAPLVVRFTNQSSGTVTNSYWAFGDGGSSSQASPTYTFRAPGVYTVTLNVAGPGGSSNVSRQINVQSPSVPVAAFTYDQDSGPSPLNVRFTNQSTGNITSYSWTFGDGTSSVEQNPLHQFVAVGTYNVILSVTGPGGTAFTTRKVTVEDPVIPPPVSGFTADKTIGDAPLQVQFINQSTGQIAGYVWDFGDGSTSTDLNPLHSFTNPGTFTVRLTAIGPGGQSSSQIAITTNRPPDAPVASFTANPTSGDIPLTVQFSSTSTGSITSHRWDFGDGTLSTEQNPTHTYTTAGTYSVRLKVEGPGGSASAETSISASIPVAVPVAAFRTSPSTGPSPLSVQFTNQSTGDNLRFEWDFGDGSPVVTEANPVHVYLTPGQYNPRLRASNVAGNSEASDSITVGAPAVAPVAAFSANPLTGTAPLTVQFTSTSTGDIAAYAWSFGDGGVSTEPNPLYTFATPGTFSASLIVSGPGGDSLPATTTITVDSAPTAPPTRKLNASMVFSSNRSGDAEIWLLAQDGQLTNLSRNPAVDSQPSWSPDGTMIAFVSTRDGNSEIYVMNADGSDVRRLTDHPANDTEPVWSADGAEIFFVSERDGNKEVYSMSSADGSNLTNRTSHPANDWSPSPSPDGNTVAFVTDRDGNAEIYQLSSDGTIVNITNSPSSEVQPAWASNGTQMAFVTDRDGLSQLYLMNPNGTGSYRISDGTASDNQPAWSPDGLLLAFVSVRDGFEQIYVVAPDGTNVDRVSDGLGNDTSPKWRP